VTNREIREGIANTYVSVVRSPIVDVYKSRKSILDKINKKFIYIGHLRIFCIALKVDWEDLPGTTKAEKAASLLEYIDKTGIMRIDELEWMVDNWT
jgi:hypothetical protein